MDTSEKYFESLSNEIGASEYKALTKGNFTNVEFYDGDGKAIGYWNSTNHLHLINEYWEGRLNEALNATNQKDVIKCGIGKDGAVIECSDNARHFTIGQGNAETKVADGMVVTVDNYVSRDFLKKFLGGDGKSREVKLDFYDLKDFITQLENGKEPQKLIAKGLKDEVQIIGGKIGGEHSSGNNVPNSGVRGPGKPGGISH